VYVEQWDEGGGVEEHTICVLLVKCRALLVKCRALLVNCRALS